MRKKILTIWVVIWCCILNVHSEKRLALVIGNSEYGKQNYLENPVHDAEDVAAKLLYLGFEVTKLTDGTLRQMDESISDFGQRAKSYDVVLFYYSGHGLQSKGENYLMPIDAELGSEADVKYKCLPLNLLLDKLDESNCPMKIVVLDACRNNPFVKRWYRGGGAMGLASVSPPKGTYITFSTAAGSVALDGTGRHSPFTQAFLEVLEIPNLALFDFFNEVGQKVLDETNGEQDPWTNHNTMKGKFFFNQSLSMKGNKRMKVFSIIPEWINTKKDNEWIGVSVPIESKEDAKKSAIINAVLKYIFSEGGVRTGLSAEKNGSEIQTIIGDSLYFSEHKKSVDVVSLLEYFDIDVQKEYFNNNNECFILCTIRRNSTARNSVKVTRKLQEDETTKSLYVTLSVEAIINEGYTKIDYCYSKSPYYDGCHHLLIDSVEIAKPAVDYEDREFISNSHLNAYPLINILECGSLGLAELALLAQYPVAPDIIRVTDVSDIMRKGDSEVFKINSLFSANNSTMPIRTTIVRIRNKHLCVSIQDPYDTVSSEKLKKGITDIPLLGESSDDDLPEDFYHLINTDSVTVDCGQCTEGPLLLKKTLQLFDIISLMSSREAREAVHITNDTLSDETLINLYDTMVADNNSKNVDSSYTSQSKTDFSNYYPFFFLDGRHSDLRPTKFVKKCLAVVKFKNN